jgi:hypothetical protein
MPLIRGVAPKGPRLWIPDFVGTVGGRWHQIQPIMIIS